MTEAEALAWLGEQDGVSRETISRLAQFVDLLTCENKKQNLVAASTTEAIWTRHIVDSAQLLRHVVGGSAGRRWLDLGSGAGFPGLIVAALSNYRVTLVEPRRKRMTFLAEAATILNVGAQVELLGARAEGLPAGHYDIVSARAFAPLDRLLMIASRFAHEKTLWVLPKGRNAQAELDAASASWQGQFRVEPSITDPEAGIIVAENVRPRGRQ